MKKLAATTLAVAAFAGCTNAFKLARVRYYLFNGKVK